MTKNILTLTVNPAIDRTITVDRLVSEDRAYILSRNDAAGGPGINTARGLTNFRAEAIAITTSGRQGHKIGGQLRPGGFGKESVEIRHKIPINLPNTHPH